MLRYRLKTNTLLSDRRYFSLVSLISKSEKLNKMMFFENIQLTCHNTLDFLGGPD